VTSEDNLAYFLMDTSSTRPKQKS